ncbi:hypothetical protein HKBW3S25_00548 [Candidatus Hakubella thermalkaliphila]|uniref:4Fe-4S ferredoxin-type domain-containing protein n=1 Tax=Candidatus Hakubella thermalkaliphila TaxID=2754717 RepID=A0A6V8NXV9_9ACTN|nr:4Fe-4S dicluster domain-containing protein [Candidatus Hakubella thermalkaliphila]GFP25098.1 hypothetical protein HKBW3S25_00548 [Candidatus Hakubella thermalkaliphila]GFP27939.1 hypothetical protein HKBW3S33_01350 [Candidatus Hakubella thermalkaliphila]
MFNPRYGLLNIESTDAELASLPTVCEQCLNPYCQHVCLPGAIYRDQNTGALVIDEDKCTGCGWRLRYCPLGVIRWEGKGIKARKRGTWSAFSMYGRDLVVRMIVYPPNSKRS